MDGHECGTRYRGWWQTVIRSFAYLVERPIRLAALAIGWCRRPGVGCGFDGGILGPQPE
jgi:hypothetical protein